MFFLFDINDLPNIIYDLSKLVLFAFDTNTITASSGPSKFKEDINNIIDNINDWFKVNSLSFNFDKTNFLKFMTKINHEISIKISCENKQIKEIKNTRFLVLDIAFPFHGKTI